MEKVEVGLERGRVGVGQKSWADGPANAKVVQGVDSAGLKDGFLEVIEDEVDGQ